MKYSGNSKVTLDPKSRLAVPSRYREQLIEQCEGRMVITRAPEEAALWLFPEPVWDALYADLIRKPAADRVRRRYINNADQVDMDNGGRILVPNALREKGILPGSTLAFMGNGTFFEIWDWEAHVNGESQPPPEGGFNLPSTSALDMAF